MTDIEAIWRAARKRAGMLKQCRLSRGHRACLMGLLDDPTHGSELARRVGEQQSNVTNRYLPRLEALGFVQREAVSGLGNNGGGRPAYIWTLTQRGQELAELLRTNED